MIDLLQSFLIIVQWIFIYILIMRTSTKSLTRFAGDEVRRFVMAAPPEDPEPEPICGCKHHLCFHDDSGCNAGGKQVYVIDHYELTTCGCKAYIGPEVLPKVIAGPS